MSGENKNLGETILKSVRLAVNDINDNSFKSSIGINAVMGEKGFSTLDRRSIRPTLDVNGIWGGYTGEGAKTVIPSKAHAKISMRLVPHQDWQIISGLFEKYFKILRTVLETHLEKKH